MKFSKKSGFTLIELLVVVTIMLIMTMVVFFNYNKFDESMLLSNFAYDMSLTIRQAQVYGVAVREAPGSSVSSSINDTSYTNFLYAYGVHFDSIASPSNFFLFIDSNPPNGIYDPSEKLQTYTFQRGINIKEICVTGGSGGSPCVSGVGAGNTSPGNLVTSLDITFLRPNPEAIIAASGGAVCNSVSICGSATIVLQNSDGTVKKAVTVSSTGQISVQSVQ